MSESKRLQIAIHQSETVQIVETTNGGILLQQTLQNDPPAIEPACCTHAN